MTYKEIIAVVLIVIAMALQVNAESAMDETYKEEIINRINQHTDEQLNNYIDSKLDSNYEEKKASVILDLDQRINSSKFFLKMMIISIFGSVLMASLVYLYIRRLVDKRSKYGN